MKTVHAFIHIPKAAGTSLKHVLRAWNGAAHYDFPTLRTRYSFVSNSDLDRIMSVHRNIRSIAGHDVSPSENLGSRQRRVEWFTFLRDPVSRYISFFQFYQNRWGRTTPFEEWLKIPDYQNMQTRTIAGKPDADAAIRLLEHKVGLVGLKEEYAVSVKMLAAYMGRPYIDALVKKKKNVANRRVTEKHITSNMDSYIEDIKNANRLDIELYEYASRELFPAHKQKYLSESDDTAMGSIQIKMNLSLNFVLRNTWRKLVLYKLYGRRY